MAARELKALTEVGTSLGYSGDELKQFVNDERMRRDREKENERAEKERVEKLGLYERRVFNSINWH